jgi:trehalose 6-phosphate synthase/phosphatase
MLYIVSNRLPVTVVEDKVDYRFLPSSGGLVSGLSSYLDTVIEKGETYTWVGWPGTTLKEKSKPRVKEALLAELCSYPVFLTEKEMDKFYYGFCNKTIWPLFHYFPSFVAYEADYWDYYKYVNQEFFKALHTIVQQGDTVWVHDYHLMLLPKLLREEFPDIKLGFFLHIPFPSYEIFRLLPKNWCRDILEGLLGADLVGFHTHDYTQYFLRCVLRMLGYEHNMGTLVLGDRIVRADTFPIGINVERFLGARCKDSVKDEIDSLKKKFNDCKVILSIDRLDYTKGILNRLRGFELFLEKNYDWYGRVILIMVVVPSRVGVEHYQLMKRQIDELVGKINGRFGKLDWTPILYQYRSFSFEPLVALYCVSDVALVTPLRDGMNLIAKEFVASKYDKSGVLILSDLAGAAKELSEAILINPNNVDEIAESLKEALALPESEQTKRMEIMQERLKRYDVIRWATDFLKTLDTVAQEKAGFLVKALSDPVRGQIIKKFANARRRSIMLDYDGTLVSFTDNPQDAAPDNYLLDMLQKLCSISDTDVSIISGRDKDTLQRWFGMLPIGLVAEHGVWIKKVFNDWELIIVPSADWKSQILPLLNLYIDTVPGSFVEEKEFSLAWHYRKADPEFASTRAVELMDELVEFTSNINVHVLHGNKVIEVRNAGADKGTAVKHLLTGKSFDFILAVGDDWTDEDLFKALPPTAFTIKVGFGSSFAQFSVKNYEEARSILEELIHA